MKVAIDLGAQVIGVNNRDLTSFEVDLNTTSRLMDQVPASTIVCALSGISGPKDVEAYKREGVKAILVGEALMRAADTVTFVRELLSSSVRDTPVTSSPLVKLCGTRTPEAARVAIEAGADLIGIILAEGRKRTVTDQAASEISQVVKSTFRPTPGGSSDISSRESLADYFDYRSKVLRHQNRALLVGVFVDQPLSYILEKIEIFDLDVVQLHGSEPIEWASLLPVPVIKKFSPGEPGINRRAYHCLPLLDSGVGGTGKLLDLSSVQASLQSDDGLRIILAGGLDSENVARTVMSLGPLASKVVAVDVSSGVETNGLQDLEKIRAFVKAAKNI